MSGGGPREVAKLTTKNHKGIQEVLDEAQSRVDSASVLAIGLVLVRADGSAFVGTFSNGHRVLLLGAVTDLQWTLCQDGEK